MRTLLFAFCLLLVAPVAHAIDLTGVWRGNDSGTYYIRQVGNEVWWLGEMLPTWSNVAHGKLSDGIVTLSWADTQRGQTRNSGILVLRVTSDNRLEADQKTGGFGGSVWTR